MSAYLQVSLLVFFSLILYVPSLCIGLYVCLSWPDRIEYTSYFHGTDRSNIKFNNIDHFIVFQTIPNFQYFVYNAIYIILL